MASLPFHGHLPRPLVVAMVTLGLVTAVTVPPLGFLFVILGFVMWRRSVGKNRRIWDREYRRAYDKAAEKARREQAVAARYFSKT